MNIMAQKKMEITISPLNSKTGFTKVGQTVKFINILEGAHVVETCPIYISYEKMDNTIVALWNYYASDLFAPTLYITEASGLTRLESSDTFSASVFRQEIGYNAEGEVIALSPPVQIAANINLFRFKDYSVTNNRWYKYIVYPSSEALTLSQTEDRVKTNWDGWSLTELHPVDSSSKKFAVSPEDVWLFKYNVETGEQAQNTIVNEQQTFGQFSRYSQGKLNYITGSVNCLLGSEMIPVNYLISNGQLKQEGGYQEKRPYSISTSSNDKIDMLQAWRRVVASGNPKVLKDRKGQAFLVIVSDAHNKPMDFVKYQPDTIGFSWRQIGTIEGLQIIGTLS